MTTTTATPGRIAVIDAIRGFAVVGILLANIQSWSGYKFLPLTEIAELSFYGLDELFRLLNATLVDGRFYSIFSILFGAGFGIQYVKNRDRLDTFIPVYRRRIVFLLLIGCVHALIWSGDILTLYALLAFALIMLRNLSDRQILLLAIVLLSTFLVTHTLHMLVSEVAAPQPKAAIKVYPDISSADFNQILGHGSLREVFYLNLHNLYWRWMDFLPNGRISRVLGLFLLGFWMARTNYFTQAIYSRRNLIVFIAIGVCCTYWSVSRGGNLFYWAYSANDLWLKAMIVLAQIFVALAYMSLLAQVFRLPIGESLLWPFTQIGRMAFTSYLSQTAIGIALFYGVGLGFYGQYGLAQLWLIALVIFVFQAILAAVWLVYFRQGPIEWLWRCMIQRKFLPNIRSQ
ncbi:DUF418 domain-containing protein [Marinobacter alexandrii]|uniref:DUF418 domain-containing protein n=1 Tax=Marinobacter alexandrii TaxID=2570351 RepID=UPI0032983A63